MGRKKKEASVPPQEEKQAAIIDIDAKHQELKNRVEQLQARAHTFASIDTNIKQPLIDELRQRIQDYIFGLKVIPKAELEREQGKIAGIEEVVAVVEGSDWEEQLGAARGELTEYERQNALTLGNQAGDDAPAIDEKNEDEGETNPDDEDASGDEDEDKPAKLEIPTSAKKIKIGWCRLLCQQQLLDAGFENDADDSFTGKNTKANRELAQKLYATDDIDEVSWE